MTSKVLERLIGCHARVREGPEAELIKSTYLASQEKKFKKKKERIEKGKEKSHNKVTIEYVCCVFKTKNIGLNNSEVMQYKI